MNIEELKKETTIDLKIDINNIINCSAENCLIHNKYLKLLIDEKLQLKKLQLEELKLRKQRYRWYMGYDESAPNEVLSDRGLKIHLEGDADLIEHHKKIIIREEKIRFLEETLSSIVARGFNIKNIIEQRKIDLGIV